MGKQKDDHRILVFLFCKLKFTSLLSDFTHWLKGDPPLPPAPLLTLYFKFGIRGPSHSPSIASFQLSGFLASGSGMYSVFPVLKWNVPPWRQMGGPEWNCGPDYSQVDLAPCPCCSPVLIPVKAQLRTLQTNPIHAAEKKPLSNPASPQILHPSDPDNFKLKEAGSFPYPGPLPSTVLCPIIRTNLAWVPLPKDVF